MVGIEQQAQMAMNTSSEEDLVRFKMKMDGLKKRLSSNVSQEEKLKDACQDFEAVFISKLWKQMQKTVPKNEIFNSRQSEMYTSMFDRDFAEKMSESGGIGLGDMLYDQLKDKLKQASRDALADKVQIQPTREPEGFPLAKGSEGIQLEKEQLNNKTLDQWLGREAELDAVESNARAMEAEKVSEVSRPLNDVEVKARIEALSRRIEARRDVEDTDQERAEAEQGNPDAAAIGRKLAGIG